MRPAPAPRHILFVAACTLWLLGPLSAAEPLPLVLVQAHAHNDYEHARPLFDALDHGFGNIEADVWLVEERLLVGHDRHDVVPGRTLATLYLDPLRARVREHGGRVYRGGPTVILLVDVKSAAAPTYAALNAMFENYADILTIFRGQAVETKAVTVVISGNRAVDDMAAQAVRYAAIDGRPGDLDTNPPAALVPWISEDWRKLFLWDWSGAMPNPTRQELKALVNRVHAQGRKLRFWNTPDRPDVWRDLLDAGVDIVGTDDLPGLADFFAARRR